MRPLNHESAASDIIVKFTVTETASVILISVLTGIILISEPVMLGAMLQAHRITAQQLGHTATSELLAVAVVIGIAGARLKPEHMKMIAVLAVLAVSLANLLTMFASGNGIVLVRLLSGAGAGLCSWLLTCLVVRSEAPARIYGITNVIVNLTGLILIQLTTRYFIPHFGPNGSYGMMLGLSLLMVIPALLIRDRLPELPKISRQSDAPVLRGAVALFAVMFFLGGFMAYWIYLVPFAAQLGYAKSTVTLAISLAVVFQILGSVAAAAAGRRAGYLVILAPCTVVALLILAALNVNLGTLAFIAAVVGLGFVWNLGIPFIAMPFLIAADPSHRTAMYSFCAQLAGSALGPFLASLFVSSQSVRGSLAVGFCLFAASLIVVVAVHWRVSAKRGTTGILVPAKDKAGA